MALATKKELFTMTCQSLLELAVSFDHYFPEKVDPQQGNFWIVNSFTEDINSCNLNAKKKSAD